MCRDINKIMKAKIYLSNILFDFHICLLRSLLDILISFFWTICLIQESFLFSFLEKLFLLRIWLRFVNILGLNEFYFIFSPLFLFQLSIICLSFSILSLILYQHVMISWMMWNNDTYIKLWSSKLSSSYEVLNFDLFLAQLIFR